MAGFMKKYDAETYAAMRIMVGLLFLTHGLSKLLSFPVAAPEMPAPILYIAGTIELVGGTFVAVGFMTRWAAFLCSGLMAAAYWMAHGFTHLIPMMNQGELAVGNVIGADILNVLFVVGAACAVTPGGLTVPDTFPKLHFPALIAILVIFRGGIFLSGSELKRPFGFLLLGCYLAYLILQYAVFGGLGV